MSDQWRTDEPPDEILALIKDRKGNQFFAFAHARVTHANLSDVGWDMGHGWFDFDQIEKWQPITTPEEERLRKRVEELEAENKLLRDCRDACAGFYRDWLALGRDRPQMMTNRLVFEAGERFLIGPKPAAGGE